MICPHCSFDNTEGRKYCRGCAKPLAPESSAPPPPVAPVEVKIVEPKNSTMAVASLVMSFLAFLLPLGIAAIAFGHISRSDIAKSNGRKKGASLAFAALILAYLQVIAVSLIIIPVIIGMWRLAHSVGGGENE